MNILAWIVLGGIAGWIASMFAKTNESMGIFANIVVGIIGAFLGGFLFEQLGSTGVTGFNFWSLFVSVVGAFVLLMVFKAFRRA